MPLNENEKSLLRDLARRVAEIDQDPIQEERRRLWKTHNALGRTRPLVLAFPEGAWEELLPRSTCVIQDPFWQNWEYVLRHFIYHAEHLRDDFVFEHILRVDKVFKNTGWGMATGYHRPEQYKGSWKWEPPMKDPADLAKLHYPELEYDEAASMERFEKVQELFGDIIPVKFRGYQHYAVSLIGVLASWRGLEQLMYDMLERPEWVHEAMRFLQKGVGDMLDKAEAMGWLELANEDHYTGSGGVAYTDQLPGPGFNGKVRLRDVWGFAEFQEVSTISPRMFEEFVLNYQIPLLDRFGLNCYNCCEDISDRFREIKRVPRLRRVSVSPFTNVTIAAKELEDKIIYSWKPNPAWMCGDFDPDAIRAETRKTLEIAKGCIVEMIMKDTYTVENHPERLEKWCDIAREEAEKAAG